MVERRRNDKEILKSDKEIVLKLFQESISINLNMAVST